MPHFENDSAKVARLDELASHIWMVRTFLKHCEEAEEDDELRDVYRLLYDYMLAIGGPATDGDHAKYLKVAKKKLKRLTEATELFEEIQPEISSHTNFKMSLLSLQTAVRQISAILKPPS